MTADIITRYENELVAVSIQLTNSLIILIQLLSQGTNHICKTTVLFFVFGNLKRQLRSALMSAHEVAAKEKLQHQQLEENMRRTLLQGITAMNLKTLQFLNEDKVVTGDVMDGKK